MLLILHDELLGRLKPSFFHYPSTTTKIFAEQKQCNERQVDFRRKSNTAKKIHSELRFQNLECGVGCSNTCFPLLFPQTAEKRAI